MLSRIKSPLNPLLVKHKPPYIATVTQDILYSLLDHCSNGNHVYQTHGFMFTRGLDQDNLLLSRFIDTCSITGLLDHAISVFSHKTCKNIYLYNTMIKALLSNSRVKDAVFVYNEARVIGLRPDSFSFPLLLKAVIRLGKGGLSLGRGVHCQAISVGLDSDVHVGVALVRMYSCSGYVCDAKKVFDEMLVRDLAAWNAMVSGYCKVGEIETACALFEIMPERNVISWTALIAGYAQVNKPSEAVAFFRRMQIDGVHPDEVAMLAALSACAQLGALELGEWIHGYIDQHNLRKSIPLNNALIDMYAKSGNINKAMEVFESMNDRCVISWTTAIAGLALHGFGKEALDMFSRMERTHVKPNDVTLIAVLSACGHGGLVELGHWHFNNLLPRYGLQPRVEHYGCMIDLLGRAGCLWEAQELLNLMPFEPNAAIWGSLLAASRIYGNVELGERALQHLIMLEPHNSGNLSLLTNMYAAAGQWNEAGLTRKVMRDIGVKKMSGVSCIELNSRVHEFISGNRSHPQSERIFEVLSQLSRIMEVVGYMYIESWNLLDDISIQCDLV
ncbi:pentatricopeptide repeat-containing protein At5g56310 [Cynara cardunculus var. scolymus]|uniref:Pentatricopeptide repeat-containing protein n=1 Tax=Cynara cardunculus var. scolymus TaxID=59895 RepID=A0A124SBK7_CYNCS|nr:pentatricopeptide repeat-containing protein At5g56310 [Cynara cardunculus var. scolymus]KVH90937.1 Pentatricopeptide repeat-containing protein [Cynara cardunculus var. scolymus]